MYQLTTVFVIYQSVGHGLASSQVGKCKFCTILKSNVQHYKTMNFRVIFICIVAVSGRATEHNGRHETQTGSLSDSGSGHGGTTSDDHADFNAFSRFLTDEGQKSFQTSPDAAYAEPEHFASSLDRGGSSVNAYKIWKYQNPRLPRASPSDKSTKTVRFEGYEDRKQSSKTTKIGNHGKSSYPSKAYDRRSDLSAMEFYTDLYSKKKDVEMILPNEKAIILPMVNGKPKPYDGYKVAPEVSPHKSRHAEDGEIIYGKPKEGVASTLKYRFERSAAEYHGGIHPHFDYSDPKNAARITTYPRETHKKRKIFKESRNENRENPRDLEHYKYPKGIRRTSKRSSGEEAEDEEAEEEERLPAYNYSYDSSIVIPELKIKYYPYERFAEEKARDSKVEGTEETQDTKQAAYDEYTASYEQYKKTLPTDLEKFFGSPDFGDYSVEASENLENNTNCERLKKQTSENATDEGKANNHERTEVCYICRDPKTGGSYARCAYKTKPKSQKYYYEGTSSFKEENSPEPVNYRYKRSAYDDLLFAGDKDVKRNMRHNAQSEYFEVPKKDTKKKRHKNWKTNDAGRRQSHDYYHGSPSRMQKNWKSKEKPTENYDGPKYFYEGPGKTYEGSSESYEIPIHKEYYITPDYGTENDEISSSSEETHNKPKANYYDYNTYHPDTRHIQSARRNHYEAEPMRDDFEENYNLGQGYVADYRFGPEHFVDDEEVVEENIKEEVESENRPKPSEKRPKNSETSQSASPKGEGREDRNVKIFKNGDVCRKKKVDGMICMVCKNEKTADTYEQCQYSSKPKDKYYAYGSQKSYRTSDPNAENGKRDSEDQQPEKSDVIEKKITITKQSKILDTFLLPYGDLQEASSDNLESHLNESQNDTDNGQESESIMGMEPRDGIEGLEEYLYSESEDDDKASDEEREYKMYDDYFHDIFPQFSNRKGRNSYSEEAHEESEEDEDETEESQSERRDNFDPFSNIRKFKQDSPDFLNEYSEEASGEEPVRLKDKRSRIPHDFFMEDSEDYHKRNIEKALGEFQSRDWSKCKKITKNKLTCYQCLDKNGVSNEECMYVEASQPIRQHLAYHEKKELVPETQGVKKETTKKEETTRNEGTEEVRTRMRRPKNALEETTTTSAQEVTRRRRPIGDFQGAEIVQEEDVMTPVPSTALEAVDEESTEKTKTLRKQKQRTKTSKKATDAITERIQKRGHPVKFEKPLTAPEDAAAIVKKDAKRKFY